MVVEYVSKAWKEHMIRWGCFRAKILKQTMYSVKIDGRPTVTTAFEIEELEVIANEA